MTAHGSPSGPLQFDRLEAALAARGTIEISYQLLPCGQSFRAANSAAAVNVDWTCGLWLDPDDAPCMRRVLIECLALIATVIFGFVNSPQANGPTRESDKKGQIMEIDIVRSPRHAIRELFVRAKARDSD